MIPGRTQHICIGDWTYEACIHCGQRIARCLCDDPEIIDIDERRIYSENFDRGDAA